MVRLRYVEHHPPGMTDDCRPLSEIPHIQGAAALGMLHCPRTMPPKAAPRVAAPARLSVAGPLLLLVEYFQARYCFTHGNHICSWSGVYLTVRLQSGRVSASRNGQATTSYSYFTEIAPSRRRSKPGRAFAFLALTALNYRELTPSIWRGLSRHGGRNSKRSIHKLRTVQARSATPNAFAGVVRRAS